MPFTPTVQALPLPGLSIRCQYRQWRDVVFDLGIDAATVGFFKLITLPLPRWHQGGNICVSGSAADEHFFRIGGKKGLFRVREQFSPMPPNVAVSQRVDYMTFSRRKTLGSVPEDWLDPELARWAPDVVSPHGLKPCSSQQSP